jgi:hypothetical protein
MIARILTLLALLLIPGQANAWWEYGHESVASVAALEMKPSSRVAVRRLLSNAALLETPTCPLRTIEDASYWPDCVKTLGERFSYAFPWHYQNVDICKPFDQASACKDGNCVSAQIERNAKLLGDPKVPVRERLMALAFLVHLVGDLHQPLHAGDRGDKGGNEFKASYGVIAGRTNLHSIWDGYLPERSISTPPAGPAAILAELAPGERETMRQGTVTDWARESWQAAHDFAYGSLMADPCGPVPATRPVIDEATTQRLIPILRRQIARGGIRLARLLDAALSPLP